MMFPGALATLSQTFCRLLRDLHLTIATAESCTAGRLATALTSQPGSSSWYRGGMVCYQSSIKEQWLGITADDIAQYGVVSEEIAKQMAQRIANLAQSHLSIASTGLAGPMSNDPHRPIGTVYIGVCLGTTTHCKRFIFRGTREAIAEQATFHAIQFAYFCLQKSLSITSSV